ncbi:21247_t:CDS:1, partial [Entrophospora sp. SA101]
HLEDVDLSSMSIELSTSILYAVRAKVNARSCVLSIGDGIGAVSSDNLKNVTDIPTNTGMFTGGYSGHTPTTKSMGLISYVNDMFLR